MAREFYENFAYVKEYFAQDDEIVQRGIDLIAEEIRKVYLKGD